ncbi:prenyltransferase/squalene oxidase repeat-containing protein [Streptomyces sp. WMMC940]|uniref:prenyltransferase/squalene oxidase repeat-containing protein n=1 Tax=Streptomyces sp. WMMC940 TaxID=3015153 RepID=UPI0022B64730|nr:prenyltransferase/squalene oxidase repeat-containing protein [Streptomyces sp. WMMC940]MCZ7460540.1 terpene cyclase/mutase family protein [Streptomyces sp. WMMC940]
MSVRRSAAALAAASAVFCVAAAPAATAAPNPSPSAALPAGLYGTKDPTYDGVWRQSLALLAQDVVKTVPAEQAVGWLTGQQCENGGFASYRADVSRPCDAKTMLDTNATAAAVQALRALGGHGDAVDKGLGWLKSVQNEDGGWSYNPGMPSDANSTSVVIGAFAAAKARPGEVKSKSGRSPFDALLTFAVPCADKAGGGAFAYQPDKAGKLLANGDATAAAVLAGLGRGLVVSGPESDGAPAACVSPAKATPEQSARNGAAYLATALAKTGHLDSPPMPGAADPAPLPDFGNTADAVLALSAAGHGDKADKAVRWLEKNSAAWAKDGGPAAYAQLILAAHAHGDDPRDFGGADLVRQLNATGPSPVSTTAPPAPRTKGDAGEEHKGGDSAGIWWIVGAGVAAGAGIGILISGRRKSKQQ